MAAARDGARNMKRSGTGAVWFRNTEYLTVRDGQIHSVDVYFGAS